MPRALITGVAGFIGSHLFQALHARGYTVDGIDDGSASCVDLEAAARHQNDPRVPGDILVAPVRVGLDQMDDEGHAPPDVIFHLAARIGVGQILANPCRMLTEHVEDALAVMKYAATSGATVVLASSSEVYRSGTNCREDAPLTVDPSTVARAGYAVTKLYAEHLALAYHRQQHVPVVIARLFNVAGPRQRAAGGCVLPIFARAALGGEPITVHGSGTQRRAFTHVDDVVGALIALAEEPRAVGQIVNVGHPQCVTIYEVACMILEHCRQHYGTASRIVFAALAATDPHAALASMEVRHGNFDRLAALTGLTLPNRLDAIVADVCADWATQLGVAVPQEAACS